MYMKDMEVHKETLAPKIYDVKDKVTLNSSLLKDIKDWKVGSNYKVELSIRQLATRELEDDSITSDFEIKSVKAI